jgi:hypothetical protein
MENYKESIVREDIENYKKALADHNIGSYDELIKRIGVLDNDVKHLEGCVGENNSDLARTRRRMTSLFVGKLALAASLGLFGASFSVDGNMQKQFRYGSTGLFGVAAGYALGRLKNDEKIDVYFMISHRRELNLREFEKRSTERDALIMLRGDIEKTAVKELRARLEFIVETS